MRNLLISTLVATVLAAASLPAMANRIDLNQVGIGNQAGGSQTGHHNKIGIWQFGKFNKGKVFQTGDDDTAS
jgi:hypothetical protein